MNKSFAVLLISSLALGACVSRGRYDQAVSTTETTRAQLQQKQTELDQSKTGDVVASRVRIGTLKAGAGVIESMPQRQFQVAGHTDNVPIHNDRFGSNWELSTGRALRVVHFLVTDGAEAKSLSAAGYSEIDPISANTTPEGRKQNRRTEISLQPNIDELVNVP